MAGDSREYARAALDRRELEPEPGVAPARSSLPLVFDLAKESRCQNGVGPLDIGEVRGEERSLHLKSSILIDRSHSRLLARADNEVFVTVPGDLERIGWIFRVDPFAEELRSPGCAPCEGDGTEQAERGDAKDQSLHSLSPLDFIVDSRGAVGE